MLLNYSVNLLRGLLLYVDLEQNELSNSGAAIHHVISLLNINSRLLRLVIHVVLWKSFHQITISDTSNATSLGKDTIWAQHPLHHASPTAVSP